MCPRYIVAENDLFVANDLCQILRDVLPYAHVIPVDDMSAVLSELGQAESVAAVFLCGHHAKCDDVELLDRIDAHQALLVRIGAEGQSARRARCEEVIAAPFTNESIQSILSNYPQTGNGTCRELCA